MAEPAKQQFGDGQDNFGQAAGQAAKAAKEVSKQAAAQAAAKGAEATANAAAATVQAGVEGGKAVAEIAAGTAAGGPWGAILSAAWAMRHTLYKILIYVCLLLTILIVLIVSLPSIVTESVFGLNGTQPDPNATLESSYSEMSDVVSAVIDSAYDLSLARVEEIILDGGYDYDLSMEALINHAQSSAGYDVCYILAAYSASLQQQGTTVDDMVAKLNAIADRMFPVTYEVEQHERLVPVTYSTSGAGKTFTLQLLALRMRMRGIQCYIIAPIKGHEFKRACSKIGGEFIKIAPGSPHCINVMEIRHTISPEMELIDEVDYNDMDSMLARKIQQLMIFFSLLIPDMTNEEEQMLDEALIKTYNEFGITHDNNSLYADSSVFPPKLKKMPILGDLHKHLLENPMTARVAAIVSRFVTGSAQSFNRQTNVDLTNKYIVLDLSELKGKLLPVGMMIALDYVWDNIKADRTKKKAIMIDEIWQLIGASSNKMAAEFCLEIFKVIRGYGGAAIAATQDLSDFFSLDDGKYGRAIINNSKNKIILNLEQDEAQYVKDVLKLTRTEVRSITQFERGEALIHSNNNKVPVVIKASKQEQEMITTDRAELEAILRKRQQQNI